MTAMDWAYVEEELRDVPDEFKEQRFYPLKHVVEIFSSGDPQGRTAELREREARLAELVDMVVENYHPGFARSIQNYSQILQLFQDSKEQVDSMRKSLNDAIRQLGAQSKHLNAQWRRNVSLQASLSLLKDIQAVVEIPKRIEAAVASKDWPMAVSQLLEGASRLAREELMQVGALRKLRGDLHNICRYILGQMCEELQDRVYSHTFASTSGAAGSGAMARTGSMQMRRQQSMRNPAGSHRGHAAGGSRHRAPMGARGSADLDAAASMPVVVSTNQLVTCLAQLDGVEEAKAYLAFNARAEVRRLMLNAVQQAATAAAQSYHAVSSAMDTAATGHAAISLAVPQHVEFLAQSLVQKVAESCLEVLSALGAVVNEIADAPVATTHSTALELIRSQAEGAPTSPKKPVARKPRQERIKYVKQEFMHVWMQMQEEWHLLLSQLLGSSLRALGVRSSAAAKRSAPSSILAQPLGWLVKFDEFAEQVSQKVEAVLGGEAPTGPGKEERGQSTVSAAPGQDPSNAVGKPAAPRFHFQLEVRVRDLAPEALGLVTRGAQDPEAQAGYAKLVPRAIGERQGTTYLTPSIYLKLTNFVEAALRVMKDSGAEVEAAREGAKARERDRDGAALWLQEAAQDLVLEVFLPQVWMDMRARLTAALEQPDAFKPPGIGLVGGTHGGALAVHGGTGHAGLAAPGPRGVVPAARFAERMLRDMAGWSQAVPTFETSFLGVAENLLSRMLDAFAAAMVSVAADSQAWRLAMRGDVAHAQATEPDAVFLGDPAPFCVPRSSSSSTGGGNTSAANSLGDVDLAAFLTTLRMQDRPVLVQTHAGRTGLEAVAGGGAGTKNGRGFAAEGEAAEIELQLLVYKEKPHTPAQLLSGAKGSSARQVALAALSESLEYISEAIIRICTRDQASFTRSGASFVRGGRGRGRGLRQAATFKPAHHSHKEVARMIEDLPGGLPALVHRCKAMAGLCVRTLRLELQLLLGHSLHGLALASHLVEPGDEAREVHPVVAGLTRVVTRIAEDVNTQLSAARATYVLAGVAPCAARMAVWLLPEIREINGLGVDRMVRTLSVLQPALIDLAPGLAAVSEGSAEAEMRLARMRAYDRARAYYGLLSAPCDEVVRLATDHPMRYGYGEWMSLLTVRVPGRVVLEAQLGALQSVLDRAHGLTAGQKIVTGLGTVLTTVITNPAEKVADVALDVLKVGGQTLVAGAMIPARQIGKVFRKLEEAVTKDKTKQQQGGE